MLPPVLWSPGCKENDPPVLEKRKMLQLSAISSIEDPPDGDSSGGGGVLQMSLRSVGHWLATQCIPLEEQFLPSLSNTLEKPVKYIHLRSLHMPICTKQTINHPIK